MALLPATIDSPVSGGHPLPIPFPHAQPLAALDIAGDGIHCRGIAGRISIRAAGVDSVPHRRRARGTADRGSPRPASTRREGARPGDTESTGDQFGPLLLFD